MRPSLADRADLRRLRPLAAQGPATAIAACLIDAGIVQLDPDDPLWADRDRLVATKGQAFDALALRLHEAGGVAGSSAGLSTGLGAGEALGRAVGMALVSARQGAAWRVWCVLDPTAGDDGLVWEVARATVTAWTLPLIVLIAGAPGPLWQAAGWTVHAAPAGDPVHLLAALDRALTIPDRPVVVAAGT